MEPWEASTDGARNEGGVIVALLGRLDEPTDALRDYCRLLAEALARRGVTLQIAEARWEMLGWVRALWRLWKKSVAWKGRWVLVQYTSLMWSRRGFPLRLLATLPILKAQGCKVAAVFHDIRDDRPYPLVRRLRLATQYWVMRIAYHWAERSIVTVPLERVPWLPTQPHKATFLPIGPNVPSADELPQLDCKLDPKNGKTVSVFCFSGGTATAKEVEAIAYALRAAARTVPGLRLMAFGRGSNEAEADLRRALSECPVAVEVRGLLQPEEISRVLMASDVQLYVRGPISTNRGSALAGIACGLPVLAYGGAATASPVTEAGVLVVPEDDLNALANGLTLLLTDPDLERRMQAKSVQAHRLWFSWDQIAGRLVEVLDGANPDRGQRGKSSESLQL